MERQLTWSEEETFQKGLRIVIIKNMFTQEEIENEVNLKQRSPEIFFRELEIDIKEEVTKIGEIEKIIIWKENKEGTRTDVNPRSGPDDHGPVKQGKPDPDSYHSNNDQRSSSWSNIVNNVKKLYKSRSTTKK